MRFPFQRGRNARGLATGPEDLYAGPIRGELLGAERLAERARVLARDQRIVHERRQVFVRRRPAKLLIRLAQSRKLPRIWEQHQPKPFFTSLMRLVF